jgi:hypothetical protein
MSAAGRYLKQISQRRHRAVSWGRTSFATTYRRACIYQHAHQDEKDQKETKQLEYRDKMEFLVGEQTDRLEYALLVRFSVESCTRLVSMTEPQSDFPAIHLPSDQFPNITFAEP